MTEPTLATRPPVRPTYGIDAPNILIGLSAASILILLVGFFMAAGRNPTLGIVPWTIAGVLAASAGWVAYGTLRTKPRVWRATLDGLGLAGTEHTLDLGCGRGLVLIETAKRVPDGHAEGVDIWRNRDQSGNRRITTELNARAEGVADRITIRDADMTRLPIADHQVDLVTASFSLRSLAVADERAAALAEVARVLKPGGRFVILDDRRTGELAERLDALGFATVKRSNLRWGFGPPARVLTATRT